MSTSQLHAIAEILTTGKSLLRPKSSKVLANLATLFGSEHHTVSTALAKKYGLT